MPRHLLLHNLVICLLLFSKHAWAGNTEGSTTTLTIDPSATSGTTITAADENDRNNDTSTMVNAHVHSLANTTSIGNGLAGTKNLCFDAADTTDMCIRFDDTNNLLLIDSPTAGTFGQILKATGTAGLTAGTLLVGDGTGAVRSLTSVAGADDQTLVWDSSTAATPRAIPNCTDASGNHLNYTASTNAFSCGTSSSTTGTAFFVDTFTRDTATASGTQAITGVGFAPRSIIAFCLVDADNETTFGFTSGTAAAQNTWVATDDGVVADTWTTSTANFISSRESGANAYSGNLSSFDADGFTVSWTRTGTPTGTLTCRYLAFD